MSPEHLDQTAFVFTPVVGHALELVVDTIPNTPPGVCLSAATSGLLQLRGIDQLFLDTPMIPLRAAKTFAELRLVSRAVSITAAARGIDPPEVAPPGLRIPKRFSRPSI